MDTDDIVLVDEQPSMKLITSSHPPSQPCQVVPQMDLELNHRPHLEIGGKLFIFTDRFWELHKRNYFAANTSYPVAPWLFQKLFASCISERSTNTALSFLERPTAPEQPQMTHVTSELPRGEKSTDLWIMRQRAFHGLKARAEEKKRLRAREKKEKHTNAINGFIEELESLSKEPILWSAHELSDPTDKIWFIPPLTTLPGMSFEQNHLSLKDARMKNMFLPYRVGEITHQRRGHITTQRKMSPKLPLLFTVATLGVPCAALLHTPHWLGSKRALAGVVSGSAGITLPSLPEEPEHSILRSLVQVLWAVTYIAFLRLSYMSLPVNRPIYLFCSLLLAAHFGLGIAGSADSNAEAVRVILGFGPLVTTACAALVYIPFRYAANVVADRSRRAVDPGDVEMAGGDETVPRANTHGDIGLERSIMHASTGFNL